MPKNTKEPAVVVSNLTKTFKIPLEAHNGVKQKLINSLKGIKGYREFSPLNDISFTIEKGDFFGIVGRNGSGKSTLLKTIAGIYTPTNGSVEVNGKLVPFIELGVGFNPELTGRENVFLNGALLGFGRKEMDAMYDEIVDFAELHNFMEERLKNYSSGMQVRLAFSIAIRADTDVLLLDEVLAVGDENFQRKCYEYFSTLKKKEKTVILVSHDMGAVRNFCNKAVLIDKGKIVVAGKVGEIVNKYTELNEISLEKSDKTHSKEDKARRWGLGDVHITKVEFSHNNKIKHYFNKSEDITTTIMFSTKKKLKDYKIGMILQDSQGRVVFATNTQEMEIKLPELAANTNHKAHFIIDNVYTNDTYTLSCAVASMDGSRVFGRVEDIAQVSVTGISKAMQHSIAHPHHSFKLD